jgi:pyruvate/2-oxoglutarate/acetoin dehydrogenase E1 component
MPVVTVSPSLRPAVTRGTVRSSLTEALAQLLAEDPRVVLLGEDIVDPYGGAFKVTRGLSARFPGRVLPTPVSEAAIVGTAVGLALGGLRPVAEIMFGDFLFLAADQLVNHAAKFRAMYNEQVSVPLVVRAPVGGGRAYGPTHSQSLEKHFLGVPGLKVVAPTHFHDPGALLRQAVADPDPVLFVESKLLYGQELRPADLSAEPYPVALLRAGDSPQVLIFSYGGAVRWCAPALERLAELGLPAALCLPSRIDRFDPCAWWRALGRPRGVVLVEEGTAGCGFTAELAARLAEQGAAARMRRVTGADDILPAAAHLEEERLPSVDQVVAAALAVAAPA